MIRDAVVRLYDDSEAAATRLARGTVSAPWTGLVCGNACERLARFRIWPNVLLRQGRALGVIHKPVYPSMCKTPFPMQLAGVQAIAANVHRLFAIGLSTLGRMLRRLAGMSRVTVELAGRSKRLLFVD